MWKRTLLILALGAATATPALAQTPQWEATATPVTQDKGPPYCRITRRTGDGLIMFNAIPDLSSVGVLTPALMGMDIQIKATLQIASMAQHTR